MRINIKRMGLFILFVALLFVGSLYFTDKQVNKHSADFIFMNNGWDIEVNDDLYNNVSLDTFSAGMRTTGDIITLKNTIPSTIYYSQPVLRFYAEHSAIEVFIDDELVYSYGMDDYKAGRLVGFGYHYISFSPRKAGHDFTVKLYVSEVNGFSRLETPVLGSSSEVYSYLLFSKRISFALIIFIIIFGFLLLAVVGFFINKKDKMLKLISIALLCNFMGLLALCNLNLISYFTTDLLIKAYLEYISLFTAPIFFLLYFFDKSVKVNNHTRAFWYNILMTMLILFDVSAIVLQALNAVHLPVFVRSCHVELFLIIVYLFYVLIEDIIKKNDIHYYIIIGIAMLIFFGLYDIVAYYLYKYTALSMTGRYQNTVYVGMFIFVMCMMIDFTEGILNALYENAKVDIYEKLAYVDQLSGLDNRRSYEDLLDDLDKSEKEYAVIGFDLNYLKEVNDSLGHDEGDKYIKEFSNVLRRVFGSHGIPCRIGGDEFAIIIKDAKDVDFKTLFEIMEDEIIRLNNIYDEWNMSVAYGLCHSYEDGVINARAAMSIADARMYAKKHEMKAENNEK